jgi:hypothetical protein
MHYFFGTEQLLLYTYIACNGLISATENNTVRKNLTGATGTENAEVQGTCMKTLRYCKTLYG